MNNLPELTGTESLVEWVNKIREGCLAKINDPDLQENIYNDVAACIEKRLYMAGEENWKKAGIEVNSILSALGKKEDMEKIVVEMARETVCEVTEAKDWINSELWYLCCISDIVAHKLIGRDWKEEVLQDGKIEIRKNGKYFNASYFIPLIGWIDATDPIIKEFLETKGEKSKDGKSLFVNIDELKKTLNVAAQEALKRHDLFMKNWKK